MTFSPNFPTVKGYAVFDPSTGMWSRGGNRVKWSKKSPKIWTSLGMFKNHLAQHIHSKYTFDSVDGGDIKGSFEYIVDHNYEGCQVFDISTQQPATDFTIDDVFKYLINHVKKEYQFNSRPLKVNLVNSKTFLEKDDLIQRGLL